MVEVRIKIITIGFLLLKFSQGLYTMNTNVIMWARETLVISMKKIRFLDKKQTKTNDLAVNELFSLREIHVKTRGKYVHALNIYCTEIEPVMMPEELIDEALEEEVAFPPIHESNRKMTKRFMKFKAWIDNYGYKGSSKIVMYSYIKTFYRDLGVKIPDKMKFKVKVEKEDMIEVDDLPSKDDILRAYHATSLRTKAIILLGLSSGLSGIDIRHLKISSLMQEFQKYGLKDMNIEEMYQIAQKNEIVPMLDGKRIKNGVAYRTFCSPEAVRAIMNYLRLHPPETEDDYVFRIKKLVRDENNNIVKDKNGNSIKKYKQIDEGTFFRVFTRLNNKIGLGDKKRESKVLPHSLRRLFASLVVEMDVNFVKAEFMIGHELSKTRRSYYKQTRPEVMREAYLTVLPSLTVLEDTKVRIVTETKDEKSQLSGEELKKAIQDEVRAVLGSESVNLKNNIDEGEILRALCSL